MGIICILVTCGGLLIEHLTIVTEWFQITFSIQNLTMFPTSDQKTETTSPIAQSLSYNILKVGRKLWNNNRDNAKNIVMQIPVWEKKWSPIDITRKYEKLCIVAFNQNFSVMTSSKWKINVIFLVENCLSYNISTYTKYANNFGWKYSLSHNRFIHYLDRL